MSANHIVYCGLKRIFIRLSSFGYLPELNPDLDFDLSPTFDHRRWNRTDPVGAHSYVIAQESLRLHIIKAQAASVDLRTRLQQTETDPTTSAQPWDSNVEVSETQGESLLHDKYASTRGDH